MANETTTAVGAGWHDLFRLGLYKRSQGRIARQVTFGALAIAVALGGWSLYLFLADKQMWLLDWFVDPRANRETFDRANLLFRYTLPLIVVLTGLWIAFRLVNMPRFADFLIAVEAEMSKVSWPSRKELFRSAMVVMIVMFGLAFTLYVYDIFWQMVLRSLGVIQTT